MGTACGRCRVISVVCCLAVLLGSVFSARAQSPLFTFYGDSPWDGFGGAVGRAGDVNADGVIDLVVGATQSGVCPGGYARVFSGRDGAVLFTEHGDCNDVNGYGDDFGWSVAMAGDVTGDGLADIIVGSIEDDLVGDDTGSAKVFSALAGKRIYTFTGAVGDKSLFGYAVAGGADLDGDGFPDLLVGSPQQDTYGQSAGAVWIFSGKDGSLLATIPGEPGGALGRSLALLSDLNGDQVPDFAVGEYGSSKVLVFSGNDRSIIFTLTGASSGDGFGNAVGDAGDVNADGFDDVIVGFASSSTGDYGKVQVFSGRDGLLLYTFTGDRPGDFFGWSVSGAGDVNGDGYADLLAGDSDFYGTSAGYAYLFSGRTGLPLYRFQTESPSTGAGLYVSELGDVNGDGLSEFVIANPGDNTRGTGAGKVTVCLGNDLFLNAMPRSLNPGDSAMLTIREAEAGARALLVVTSVNGAATFLPWIHGSLDATGSWLLSGTVPPTLSGSTVSLRAYVLTQSGRIMDSADETLVFN